MSVEEGEMVEVPVADASGGLTAAILAAVTDGITVQDSLGRLLYANDAAARLVGFESAPELLTAAPGEVVSRFELLDEERRPLPYDLLPGRIAIAEGREDTKTLCYRVRGSGDERWSVVRALPIPGEDGRTVAVNVIRDITEQKRASDQLLLLSDASELLVASLDFEPTLAAIAAMLVPGFADYCLIDLVEPDGELRQVVLRHVDPVREQTLAEIRRRYPPGENEAHPATVVLASGAPLLIEVADDAALREAALDDEHLELYRSLDPSSYLVVPLVARGRTTGTISLGMGESGRHYRPADIAFAQEVASRIALAVDNARLYSEAGESLALLDTLLVSAPVGIGFWDRELRFVRVNDALAEINGLPPEEHAGKTLREVLPGLAPVLEPLYRRVLETGRPVVHQESTDDTAFAVGDRRHWLSSYYPVRTEDGETIGVGAVIMEVTGQRRADERLRLLAEAGELFSSSLDREEILERVARVIVPRLADSCNIYLAEGEELRRVGFAHVDPEVEPLVASLPSAYSIGEGSTAAMARVFRQGEAMLFSTLEPDFLANLERLGVDLETFGRIGTKSMLFVPLVARGATLGVITIGSRTAGRLDRSDLELAKEIARRAAAAVENARLYEESARSAAVAQESLALLDTLLDSAPVGFAFFDRDLRFVRINDALAEINGLPVGEHLGRTLVEVLPELGPLLEPIYRRVLETGEPLLDQETAGTTAAAPGVVRHWLSSYYPVRSGTEVIGLGAVVVEVTDRKRAEEQLLFLAEASSLLASSLDYETTLRSLARLAVPHLADWCSITMREEDGSLHTLAVAHRDPERVAFAEELVRRYPPEADAAYGAPKVIRTGEPELVPVITDELIDAATADHPELRKIVHELGLRSSLIVPLLSRGAAIGAITLVAAESGRRFGERELELARELARRAAVAVDNARLFGELNVRTTMLESQQEELARRAQAAQALEFVGDAVFLLDAEGRVRLWNPAAAALTGLREADVVGRRLEATIPSWADVERLVPVTETRHGGGVRAETVPIEIAGRELWLSISGVAFGEGTVYAFRDLTEERAVERLKSDFVSTVSHELRTPLAAIYGAAMTLRRADVPLSREQEEGMLGVVAGESERLARIVNDILLASRLDSDVVEVAIGRADAGEIARSVLAAAEARRPPGIALALVAPEELPEIAADADKVRQVLVNLVDNAIKYSPDGGLVEVELAQVDGRLRFAVHDRGLGIPAAEHGRVFEKFFRLDPNLTRGVGGTGLGLYICREIVRRMDGRIWVDSDPGRGSTFSFELPLAH